MGKKDEKINVHLSPNRVFYSESVKIGIGDYESRDVTIGVTTDAVGRRFGNLFESKSAKVKKDESSDDAIKRAEKIVTKRLYKREKTLRKKSAKFVSHETMDKVIK